MSLLAAAALVLPLVHQPEPYQMPAPGHERATMSAIGAVGDQIPKSIWSIASDGGGTHLQSTLTCAKSVGEFERTDLDIFDGFGLDVACNYNRSGGGTITIYLTRRKGEQLADDFSGADAAIKQRWSDVKAVEGTVPAPAGLSFQSVMYARADGSRTGLWVADVGGWTYTIRATFAPDLETKIMSALTSLTDAMRSSAGTHLSACAAAPAVTRSGTQITDSDRTQSLSLMASVLEASAQDKVGPNPFPENWCAEEPGGDDEAPVLFWRNIALTTEAGPMDKVTVMTIGEPPTLLSVANPTASLVEKDARGKEAKIYQLSEKRGTTTYVFAFFEGRPSAKTLAPIAKEIFLGRQDPLTSFDPTSNTINITMPPSKPGS